MSTDRPYPKPERRQRDSGELDVFEAARYFSGSVDGACVGGRALREERVACRAERMSSDKPAKGMPPQQPLKGEECIKNRKCKQPSSPGNRLASFLNSLLHQSAPKKKSAHPAAKDEREEGHGSRKRSNSISHSKIISSSDSRSMNSYESSGFRTPASHPSNPKCGGRPKSVAFCPQSEPLDDRSVDGFVGKSKVFGNGWLERGAKLHGIRFVGGDLVCSVRIVENRWVSSRGEDGFLKGKEKGYQREDDDDDDGGGGESDSSSDLFELKNYELRDRSSGLPVYGSTEREIIIKKEAAIASAAF